MKKRIILDTDPGHDDALAFFLLVSAKNITIEAITTVAGNATIENVTRNAFYLRNLSGKKDIPIFSGSEKPLKQKLSTAVIHGENGLAGVDVNRTEYTLTKNAVTFLEKYITENKKEIILLAIGPLTNIAKLFLKNPKIPRLLKELVIMGGAIDVVGNMNRVAEFNFFVDPDAASIVLGADVKKTLIPLDVCNQTALSMEDFAKMKESRLYPQIKRMMKHFIKGIKKEEGLNGAIVYDALASYFIINPDAFSLEPMDLVVETIGIHSRGMTVPERRISKKKRYNVNVAMKIDVKEFKNDFIAQINSLT